MHGMDPHEEIDYWRERAKRAEAELTTVRRTMLTMYDEASAERDRLRAALERMYQIAKGTFAVHLMTPELADELDQLRRAIGGDQ